MCKSHPTHKGKDTDDAMTRSRLGSFVGGVKRKGHQDNNLHAKMTFLHLTRQRLLFVDEIAI